MVKSRKSYFRLVATLAAVLTLALGGLFAANQANAASVQTFENAAIRNGYKLSCCPSNAAAPAYFEQFDNAQWTVISKGTVNGHGMVQMQSADRPAAGCLDSHGNGAGGSVWVQGCNTGDYQLWEVFHVSDGTQSYVVFKSRGAYTHQGKHLCIAAKSGEIAIQQPAILKTCDTGDVWQRYF